MLYKQDQMMLLFSQTQLNKLYKVYIKTTVN